VVTGTGWLIFGLLGIAVLGVTTTVEEWRGRRRLEEAMRQQSYTIERLNRSLAQYERLNPGHWMVQRDEEGGLRLDKVGDLDESQEEEEITGRLRSRPGSW